ncbi:MAG: phosphoribosylformylglycinamidine cyclo-ligase [Thermoplasmata archaeon]
MVKTYKEAGVDIDAEGESIRSLVSQITFRRDGLGALRDIPGFFTGLIDFGECYLSLCTDSVGTKMIVASSLGKWDTVGIDCIAMSANDMICVGAEPLAFVDYFAVEKYDKEVARQIGIGLNEGAKQANISLVGGEFATLPEVVKGFDLAGTCLGFVGKDEMISGLDIAAGDSIVGLASSGIHSNGLTLARKILSEAEVGLHERPTGLNRSVGEELLEPTRIYVRGVLGIINEFNIKGMANITGGGLRNLARLKKDVRFTITDPMEPFPIFTFLQELGGIEDEEMYQTFNMGLGFAIVCEGEVADSIARASLAKGVQAKVIGEVDEGSGVHVPDLGLSYEKY